VKPETSNKNPKPTSLLLVLFAKLLDIGL